MFSFISCKDDIFLDSTVIGQGEASIRAELHFYEISNNLKSRAQSDDNTLVSGGTSGKAIGEINSLCVLIYDLNGDLVKKYNQSDLEDYEYKSESNSDTSSDAIKDGHQAENKTGRATFNIGVAKRENRIAFGKYRMYAVANMGDLSDYTENIATEEGLKKISLSWKTNIAENNQMFGYFTKDTEKKSEDFNGDELIINQDNVILHAWIKRLVSKVTVAFDARNLKENIYIYIKSVEIKDIPNSCYLGAENPGNPGEEGSKGQEISFVTEESGKQVIKYHDDNIPPALSPETWEQFLAKGHPIYGADPAKANDPKLSIDERLKAQHTEDINALYFFENMQGKGIEGTASDKRQQVKQEDKDNKVTSYPNGNDPADEGWKDAKPYGTYIEVKAYYFSINPGDPGQGDIIYRFMLGKDETLDYNAMRNYHYKLTLCFNGYANDVDWHIVYEQENRRIKTPNPYYISYLYNHSMMLPIDIDAGSATVTKIEASISSNGWAPIGHPAGGTSGNTPDYNQYFLYWDGVDNPEAYPWNGFLSLRETSQTVVKGTSPWVVTTNQSYYDSTKRGNITYSPEEKGDQYTDFENSSISVSEALEDGKLHVVKTVEGNKNIYVINMPLWTRAKQLVKETAYTGNNPYMAYQREAKIKLKVHLSDGTTLTTGLTTNNGQQSDEEISIRQVRRIVNPKGIWRSGGKDTDFHVVLKYLKEEEATNFKNLISEGPWRAYVMRDTKRGTGNLTNWDDQNGTIHLERSKNSDLTTTGSVIIKDKNGTERTYQTIEGSTGSNIDFMVKFNGTTSEDSPNYAIIRVEYHNYTCYHLIFVRQGYGADRVTDNGAKWMASNNITGREIASNPLDEGSMFKFGKWTGIKSSNNKNGKSPWTSIAPNDFKKNAADDTELLKTDGKKSKWEDMGYENIDNTKFLAYQNDQTKIKDDAATKDAYFTTYPETGMRVAEYQDYYDLYSNIDVEQGFGVLYGDDSSETLDNIDDVYGYMADDTNHNKGMRGCFVYNYRTGKNLFFPIGASGYGHRKDSQSDGSVTHRGVLRYASSSRWGYFPSGKLSDTYSVGIDGCPLFFDIFRRPGALYWLRKPFVTPDEVTNKNEVIPAWDFNYFTFDFHSINVNNVANGMDGLLVRSVAL